MRATGITGLLGRPYVDLEPHLDLSALPAIHDEVCLGLTQIPVDYTGGSHRSMGIAPPSRAHEVGVDYGEVIRGLDDDAFATLASLADEPWTIDRAARESLEFGEERAVPLSRRQMLWLERRHKVYFPWKVFVELMASRSWADRSDPEGKAFTRRARAFFPQTVAFVERLPFASIGRVIVLGLAPHDHGTVHRDGEPDQAPGHFITLCPAGDKRLFLWDEAEQSATPVTGRAYWFNDHDYHGVDADPFFRYSIRVDGVFEPSFLEALERAAPREAGAPR